MGYLRQLGRIEVQQTGQNNYKNKILNWDILNQIQLQK